jgi:hypothetical protein
MEAQVQPTEIKKPTSIPALGFALICLGAMGIFFGAFGSMMFSMVNLAEIAADQPGITDKQLEMFAAMQNLSIFFAAAIPFGAVYILGGFYLRQFKLWANRLICICALVGMIAMPLLVYYALRDAPGTMSGMRIVYSVEGLVPGIALIWFLNSKKIRPHFT